MNRSAQPGARRVAFNASLPESSEAFFNRKHRDVINSVEESIKRHSATSSKIMRKFATQPVKFLSVPDSVMMIDETISHLCGLGLSRYYTLEYMNSQNPDLVYFLEGYMTILASFCTIAGIDEHSCPLAMKEMNYLGIEDIQAIITNKRIYSNISNLDNLRVLRIYNIKKFIRKRGLRTVFFNSDRRQRRIEVPLPFSIKHVTPSSETSYPISSRRGDDSSEISFRKNAQLNEIFHYMVSYDPRN